MVSKDKHRKTRPFRRGLGFSVIGFRVEGLGEDLHTPSLPTRQMRKIRWTQTAQTPEQPEGTELQNLQGSFDA